MPVWTTASVGIATPPPTPHLYYVTIPQVCIQSRSPMEKKMTLLTFVKDQVSVDPGKFHKFIELLCKRPPMADVVRKLEKTYCKFL